MALAPAVPPRGLNVGAVPHNLSFVVTEVQPLGRNAQGKERHWIKVAFNNGTFAAFDTHSKSLKTALEMIEVIGRETETQAEFNTYLNANQGKRTWFDMRNISKQAGVKTDRVIAYKADRHGNSLKFALPRNPHGVMLQNDRIESLKAEAKHQQLILDSSAQLTDNRLQVHLREVS
jgi:hypothetical protein